MIHTYNIHVIKTGSVFECGLPCGPHHCINVLNQYIRTFPETSYILERFLGKSRGTRTIEVASLSLARPKVRLLKMMCENLWTKFINFFVALIIRAAEFVFLKSATKKPPIDASNFFLAKWYFDVTATWISEKRISAVRHLRKQTTKNFCSVLENAYCTMVRGCLYSLNAPHCSCKVFNIFIHAKKKTFKTQRISFKHIERSGQWKHNIEARKEKVKYAVARPCIRRK